jgi:uncharacterized protein involved in exopolysaccharide biosynthesis
MLMFQSRPLLEDVVTKLGLSENRRFLDVSGKRSWRQVLGSLIKDGEESQDISSIPKRTESSSSALQTTEFVSRRSLAPQSAAFPDFPESDPRLDQAVSIVISGLDVIQEIRKR